MLSLPRVLSSRCRLLPWLCCLGVLGWLGAPSAAVAQEAAAAPVYLWGIQSGCESQEQTSKNLANLLDKQGVSVQFLRGPQVQPLPVCPGLAHAGSMGCMDALKAHCPGGHGSVIGGLIEKGKGILRTRLWLYDLASGRRAVRDDYCQQCDPDSDKVLAAHVSLLLAAPPWEPALSSQPMYCRDASDKGARRAGRLYLGVFGASFGAELRTELANRITLKRAAGGLEPPQIMSERLPPEKITSGLAGSQVLMIEKGDGGKATLTLWDQKSKRLASRSVSCAGSCLEPLSQAAAELQDLCFEAGCAGLQPADLRPLAACDAPFSGESCPAFSIDAGGERTDAARLSRSQATSLMALLGTGIGLSVATTLGFWIANETVTLRLILEDGSERTYNRLYTPAAAALTVLSASLIGLSVPGFTWLNRHRRAAEKTRPGSGGPSPAGSLLVCPGAASPEPSFPTPSTARLSRPRGEE